ncbi:hypothetical protein PUR23_24870 [Methylorubrum populi]|jgi:hypothetical protein|uniref:hypothetical protein n=1 Tax=Alphaproteobacteria TaxID=28211 RepID=UPI00143DBB2B|nr:MULTISPECIES: hypothetical protein [Alphaproteobacteria]MCX4195685.1 hypothetical protein [Methylobacterium organophilum]MBR3193338.1 hypothetical protein [Bosea sp. (in: a-proteobacteria)]MDH0694763.1 hypothetical protein [Agrobacterium sp. GD03871]MDH0872909.1 hypothetical protein [Agrobacterium pusense]MDH1057839.1 hypothetical protein [Agrobacterium sp. GD03992]
MAKAPHIAQSQGNSSIKRESAGCADQAHLAQMRHKSLKKHDRTKPHLARFYLAIVRLC